MATLAPARLILTDPAIDIATKGLWHVTWNVGEPTPVQHPPGHVIQTAAVLTCEHSIEHRRLTATLAVENMQTGCTRSWWPGVVILVEPIGRYSGKRMAYFTARATATLRGRADEPIVRHIFGEE